MLSTPPTADTLARLAASLLGQSRAAAAEKVCRQALALAPTHVSALEALGLALTRQERYDEAARAYTALTRLQPFAATHWMNLGTTLRSQRRLEDALAAYARAAQLGARSADFFYNAGLLHLDRTDYESAREVLARALEANPAGAEISYWYAHACYESQRTEEAVAALERWSTREGVTSDFAARVALLLLNLGEPALAAGAVRHAAADPHPAPATELKLAQIYERTNRVEDARAAVARLRSGPAAGRLDTDLLLLEAQLAQRAGDHEQAAALYSRVLNRCADFGLRHRQLFPLAKCLDALKRHDEAFRTLIEAHRSQVTHLSRTLPTVVAKGAPPLHITRHGVDEADVAAWSVDDAPPMEESPVFIVAFPRSGTTLLEQALDAHPALRTMDEQPFLQKAIDALIAGGAQYPERLAALSREQLDAARAAYWTRVRRKVQLEPGQRLIDKNPLNLLRLPAIRRLFPNSPVLFAVRHPCDVILSCFMQQFRAPEFVLLCADLETLADGYSRAVDFWYQQAGRLAPHVHEVRYESFVRDFENGVREVCEFLGVPLHEAMLEPGAHAAQRFISTPSYAQVAQPVHARSVGRWQAYRAHLGAVIERVQPQLERWGYPA